MYERKITIEVISPTVAYVWRVLQPAYLSGYDEVRLTFKDTKALAIIERFVTNIIGFEIVETSSHHVLIKSISKQLDEEFPTILKRSFLVLKQMADITQEVFDTKDKKLIAQIRPLEMTINKYTNFLRRLINRMGYKYPHYMYLIVTYLELTSNHLDYLYRYYERNPRAIIEKQASKEFAKLQDLIYRTHDLYYNYTPEKFRWISEELPHFNWFEQIQDFEVRYNFKSMAEYLVQISRQIAALHL
ncbi:MAG TPA: hypothetical protein VJG90_04995 [Candidatus Nanoarchaeia archaeon]|nr:hypothetical protein [Candidatus Nanoarchaeia archaeon]